MIITDTDEFDSILPLLKTNVKHNLNDAELSRTKMIDLSWGKYEITNEIGKVHTIIASDVVYQTKACQPLVYNILELSTQTTDVITYYKRRLLKEDKIFELLKNAGFYQIRSIDSSEMFQKVYNAYILHFTRNEM